jgi:hypothetical protein
VWRQRVRRRWEMQLEGIRIPGPGRLAAGVDDHGAAPRPAYTDDFCGYGEAVSTVDYILQTRTGVYNAFISRILTVASTWAYSDLETFAKTLYCGGSIAGHEAVGVTVFNPALLLGTSAYLVQSEDKRLVILCFRGTEMQGVTDALTDASTRADHFFARGKVHGGFYRGVLGLWSTLEVLLRSAQKGYSICDAGLRIRARYQDCIQEPLRCGRGGGPDHDEGGTRDILSRLPPGPTAGDEDKLEGLYITGHSLGGALAVIAAALLHVLPDLDGLRQKLRGVYTYGQPMVGHKDFAEQFDQEFGDRLFRHVYGNDIVPRLPPRTIGPFDHFGKEYTSSEGGWLHRSTPLRQVRTFTGSMLVGVAAWLLPQFAGIPFLRWLPFSLSWGDHEPLHYLRTSLAVGHGAELL